MRILPCTWIVPAVLLAAIQPAAAELFASPMTGHYLGNQIVCYLANVGSTAIAVKSTKIVNSGGASLAIFVNSCGSSLAAGRICVWAAWNTSQNNACRSDLSSKANARGVMDVRVKALDIPNDEPVLLLSVEMR